MGPPETVVACHPLSPQHKAVGGAETNWRAKDDRGVFSKELYERVWGERGRDGIRGGIVAQQPDDATHDVVLAPGPRAKWRPVEPLLPRGDLRSGSGHNVLARSQSKLFLAEDAPFIS